jgi:hypothetical protein
VRRRVIAALITGRGVVGAASLPVVVLMALGTALVAAVLFGFLSGERYRRPRKLPGPIEFSRLREMVERRLTELPAEEERRLVEMFEEPVRLVWQRFASASALVGEVQAR